MDRQAAVGDVVMYHDPNGRCFSALVTEVWTPTCINVVLVSGNKDKQDEYGRQIERQTSLSHKSTMNVHGFYWRFPDEEPNPYVPPAAT